MLPTGDDNPYRAPVAKGGDNPVRRIRTRRKAALVFFVLPFAVSPLLRYWVFKVAGGWFVRFDMEPEHRAAHLAEGFLINLFAITSIAWFVALALLYLDGYRRSLTGCLLVPVIGMALLGLGILALMIQSYFTFSGR